MASATYKGRPCLHCFLVVPKSEEASMDALLVSHQAFMKSAHSVGTGGAAPHMLDYAWQKGVELNDPLDAKSGETGNLCYLMTEVYAEPSDIEAHMAIAGEKWADMGKFMEVIGKYKKHMDVGSTVVACLSDEATPCCYGRVGDPTVQISWVVPAEMEAETDALWVSHEAFMRSSHTSDLSGDEASDAAKPRLTSYTVAKTKQATDPMHPENGLTGMIEYVMSESYAAPSGVAGHFGLGMKWDGWDKLMELNKKATFLQAGAASVVQTMK